MNVGLLGHVDSGKTTLARTLSTLGSTAAFDKHANTSNLRANTVDLGFSTVTFDGVVLAIVDCPGHASLVKAVLAAATVFDMAIVLIDAAKGIEPQTSEHLLLVSILCPQHVIIVLNKIDIAVEEDLARTRKQVAKALNQLKLSKDTPIVPVSLLSSPDDAVKKISVAIKEQMYVPERMSSGKFVMSVDHCFPIKGKGSVLTGTIIDGKCRIGMDIEIPILSEKRKVKAIQCWKKDVQEAEMGERVALLVSNLPEKHLNRFAVFEPRALFKLQCCLAKVTLISFFKGTLTSHTKLHVSVGFDTVMATCQYLKKGDQDDYEVLDELCDSVQYAIISFERPVFTKESAFYIASKLDSQGKGCRFAFYGTIISTLNCENDLKRFRKKHKTGVVERIENETSLICSSLFKKGTDLTAFKKMQIQLSTGEVGVIEGGFGKSGKIRITFGKELEKALQSFRLNQTINVELFMKKYLNDGLVCSYIPNR